MQTTYLFYLNNQNKARAFWKSVHAIAVYLTQTAQSEYHIFSEIHTR